MLAKLKTFSLLGIEALPVEVEVDVSPGAIPKTVLVGLPEAAVKESTHRVARAIVNSGFVRPQDRVVINLAPAELPKQAASFDLPITLGILAGSGQIDSELFDQYAVVGELALEGTARPVKGALSMAMEAARQAGLRGLVVPSSSAREAAVVEDVEVIAVDSLAQAVGFFSGQLEIEPTPSRLHELFRELSSYEDDFVDVKGQEMAKRALTIAAAGGHNLLMIGPPGSGKTMLAKRMPTVLPALSSGESIETTRIYSAVGRLAAGEPLMARRPFRDPHHTISDAGLVGGGSTPSPGEISLAHNGVLFLDELPEFNRRTLEVLRQPLEDGTVTVVRVIGTAEFPARFMLAAAMNPCPCGYLGSGVRDCSCTPPIIDRYRARISGPLLDRIDLHVHVPAVSATDLARSKPGESSAAVRERVVAARTRQAERNQQWSTLWNAYLRSRDLSDACVMTPKARKTLEAAMSHLGLSARAHDRVLKVARTIADLAEAKIIDTPHVAEAVQYRSLDRRDA